MKVSKRLRGVSGMPYIGLIGIGIFFEISPTPIAFDDLRHFIF
jgi:hypothetical protein